MLVEPTRQVVRWPKVAAAVGRELGEPPFDLALEEALGVAEIGETHRTPIERVYLDQGVDELFDRSALGLWRRDPGFGDAPAYRHAVDAGHHIERRTENRQVGARDDRSGYPHRGVLQRNEDAVLAQHVVRTCGVRVCGSAAKHPTLAAPLEREHLARAPAGHGREGHRCMVAQGVVEEAKQRGGVLHHTPAAVLERPAAARSSCHLSNAAGRRLGMCSVGHPTTG